MLTPITASCISTQQNAYKQPIRATVDCSADYNMSIVKARPHRSTTLISGSSNSNKPAHELCLRRSLSGHWTLIEPVTHKARYHVSTPEGPEEHPTREIRRENSEGPLLGTVRQDPSSSSCHLNLFDRTPIEIKAPSKLSFAGIRGHHPFEISGRHLYWKWDRVCRESITRRVYAEVDSDNGDMLNIYEGAEDFIDVIVAGFIAMKYKHERCPEARSWFNVLLYAEKANDRRKPQPRFR